jgi:hypothetical protein
MRQGDLRSSHADCGNDHKGRDGRDDAFHLPKSPFDVGLGFPSSLTLAAF